MSFALAHLPVAIATLDSWANAVAAAAFALLELLS
jgi:hypothetical protein